MKVWNQWFVLDGRMHPYNRLTERAAIGEERQRQLDRHPLSLDEYGRQVYPELKNFRQK